MAILKNNSSDGYNILFAKRIKELMNESKVSQTELAKVAGVTRQAISSYSQGTTIPDIEKFGKIADYFEVTADYLLGRSDARDVKNTALVEELGLWDKSIEYIKKSSDQYPAEDERNLHDILNIILSDDLLPGLLEIIANRTLPKSHCGATAWGDQPMQPHFQGSDAPDGKMSDAAYTQISHMIIDTLVDNVGQYSVEKWYQDQVLKKKNTASDDSKND